MKVKTVLLIEGCVNLFITVTKLIVGYLTNSSAIIADALHSLTDIANNVMAWIAINLAKKPADADHPYGHQKYEQLAVFGLAALLSIVAFEVLIRAVDRFGQVVEQSYLGLSILIVTLLVNIGLTIWERYWSKRLDSDILNADASHTFGDVLTTLTVIVGWQLAAQGFYWLDTLFAVGVSFIIFYLAFKLFQRAIPILVDYSDVDPKAVTAALEDVENIDTIVRVRARTNFNGRIADVIIKVDPNLSTIDSHIIADEVEKVLADKFDIQDVIVHIEPKEHE